MFFIGCDLHKQSIALCVVDQSRCVHKRQTLFCAEEDTIRTFFESWKGADIVVEATASYEWFVRLVEPYARRVLLAHPKKLRVIAESTRKSDRLDAQTLAEFLSMEMVPTSFRPTPRQRDHRRYVRHRDRVQKRITSVKNRIRRILSDYNADRKSLFTVDGLSYLKDVSLSPADRDVMNQFLEEYEFGRKQLAVVESHLRAFAEQGTILEQERRELLQSIPGVGFVTAEVILAEIGDIQRFSSEKKVVAYAGLSPGQRESAGKSQELHLEKNGSKLLRTAMIEAAWRLIRHSQRWRTISEKLKARVRAKKAIVAVARRLLGMTTAILKSGQPYSHTHNTQSRTRAAC